MTTLEKINAIRVLMEEAESTRVDSVNKKIQRLINSIPMEEYLLYAEKLTKLIPQHEKPTNKKIKN